MSTEENVSPSIQKSYGEVTVGEESEAEKMMTPIIENFEEYYLLPERTEAKVITIAESIEETELPSEAIKDTLEEEEDRGTNATEALASPISAELPLLEKETLNLNNEVVKMRKEMNRARALVIRKLTRQMTALKKKKGNDAEVERNHRRAARLLEEIHEMKRLKPDLVTKKALQKKLSFDVVCNNPKFTIADRALTRIATQPQFSKKIEAIKEAVKAFKEERMKGGKRKIEKYPKQDERVHPQVASNYNKGLVHKKDIIQHKEEQVYIEDIKLSDKVKPKADKVILQMTQSNRDLIQKDKLQPEEICNTLVDGKQIKKAKKTVEKLTPQLKRPEKVKRLMTESDNGQDNSMDEQSADKEENLPVTADKKREMPVTPMSSSINVISKSDKMASPKPANEHVTKKLPCKISEKKLNIACPRKMEKDEEESNLGSSDDDGEEEKEYFDDSTEERFHRRSSESGSEDEDDFFLGKVSKFKTRKGKWQRAEGKTVDERVKCISMDPQQSLSGHDEREARLNSKGTKLDSVFCSTLSGSKASRGGHNWRGGGRGRDYWGDEGMQRGGHQFTNRPSKFQKQDRWVKGKPGRDDKLESEGRQFEADGKGTAVSDRGRGHKRGDFRQQDGKGTSFSFQQAPQQALHPSWEASKKRKEQQGMITAFQGKKIKFDD